MEAFWFFRLRFRRACDSAYDSDFRFSLGLLRLSLRSKRFRGAKSEEWVFDVLPARKMFARAKIRRGFHISPYNSLLPNCTETIATQATYDSDSDSVASENQIEELLRKVIYSWQLDGTAYISNVFRHVSLL